MIVGHMVRACDEGAMGDRPHGQHPWDYEIEVSDGGGIGAVIFDHDRRKLILVKQLDTQSSPVLANPPE